MIALLIAAQLAAPAGEAANPRLDMAQPPTQLHAERWGLCRGEGFQQAALGPSVLRPQDAAKARPRSLDRLPKANLEHAVMRLDGFCMKAAVVRHNVGR